jgi:hypothetical protein
MEELLAEDGEGHVGTIEEVDWTEVEFGIERC